MKERVIYFIVFTLIIFSAAAQNKKTFSNPILPSGADPWSIYKDGYYYYTQTMSDSIVIWKTKDLAELKTAERKTIFIPPPNTYYSKQLWAPEIHFINNKWYVYFAADNGKNETHRLYVIENNSVDPFVGDWTFKGKISDRTDKWAIDGSVLEHRKKLYMVWSGWHGDENGKQDLYIAKMKNPYSIKGKRVRISSAIYDWEKHGDLNDPNNPPHVDVNEGPQILKNKKQLFMVYSASGCWTEYYSLGMLTFTGKRNLLDSSKWVKSTQPVFKRSIENGVYAPGHNSFFKSPDGKQDWILYHANSKEGEGCGRKRSPRAQQFTWLANGEPFFGEPVKTGMPIEAPSNNKQN